MKRILNIHVALLATVLVTAPAFAQSVALQRGLLRLPEFARVADKASETVNVTPGSKLLGIACRFLDTNDPEEADAKKLCTSLRGVFVRSFKFDEDFAYPKSDIDSVRRQLSAPGWSRIVESRSKKEHTDVDVFVLIENDKAMGLAIIANQPREFTIVNIVGAIDLENLHDLEGKFGVPNLGIESAKKPAEKK